MGTPTQSQRKGKGSSTFRANTKNSEGSVEHLNTEAKGTVVDIVHDPARSAPVAKVEFEAGHQRNILAPEGLTTGQEIVLGTEAPIEEGNTLPLGQVPEGVPIHNIELQPNDGGKLVRSSGTYAFVVTHEKDGVRISLPSDKMKKLSKDCRATIGKVAGGGRKNKPFVKAGNKYKAMKARGKKYPKVSAVAMNAVDHPFGGSANPGQAKSTSRDSSPGSKVGSIASSRTGNKEE